MNVAAAARAPRVPGRQMSAWASVLAVVAHPDDESFGLGAVIDRLAAGGTAVHVLCYTHGEASTLNETGTDLHRARESELRRASTELGAASVTLLDYPDGRLAGIPPGELAPGPAGCSSSTTPGSPGTLTTWPPPCWPGSLPACRSWPGRCRRRWPASSKPRPAALSPGSRRA